MQLLRPFLAAVLFIGATLLTIEASSPASSIQPLFSGEESMARVVSLESQGGGRASEILFSFPAFPNYGEPCELLCTFRAPTGTGSNRLCFSFHPWPGTLQADEVP